MHLHDVITFAIKTTDPPSLKKASPTDGPTDGPTDRPTDGRTNPPIELRFASKKDRGALMNCVCIFGTNGVYRSLSIAESFLLTVEIA